MRFELSQLHIQTKRLTPDEYSKAAGFSVRVFALSDFPYYEELLKKSITESQLNIRAEAILAKMEMTGLVRPFGPFKLEDATALASQAYPTIRSYSEFFQNFSGSFMRHLDLIRKHGFEQAHADPSIWYTSHVSTAISTSDVLPGVLTEEIPVGRIERKAASFVLVDYDMTERDFWGRATRMNPLLVENLPGDDMHCLQTDLHERRHMQQITFSSSHVTPKFYCELDADMSAESLMEKAGIGERTLTAIRHKRYLELLGGEAAYWFAESWALLKRGQQPPDFFVTARAVMELRLRLAMFLTGEDSKSISSREMQQSLGFWTNHPGFTDHDAIEPEIITQRFREYDRYVNSLFNGNPAPLYTALRHLYERNEISDPLTKRLALKVMEGIHYFNPDLLYNDHEPARRRLLTAVMQKTP